jgi:tRNA(Ile)-lysidine synthase
MMERDPVPLAHVVADQLRQLVVPGSRCVIAVSGGPDSLALLDLLHLGAARHGCELIVGHVDHGMHPDSEIVAHQVESAAAARGLPFRSRRLSLPAGTSETRARVARRAALTDLANEAGADHILLAHHADDQAETVLLRVLRGTGPAGLSGMLPRYGRWVRPLLGIRRATLAGYLAARGISAWQDPANTDVRHLRSWLRTTVQPVLVARLPDVVERLHRTGSHAAEARVAWDQAIDALTGLEIRSDSRGISVAAAVLAGYRSPLRHAVLAGIGRRIGALLGERRLAVLDRLLDGHSDGGVASIGGGVRAELAFGRLTFCRNHVVTPAVMELLPGTTVEVGVARMVTSATTAGPATRDGWRIGITPGQYAVRGWRPGDRIRPLDGRGSRAVATLLRERRIPPAQRRSWPVVVDAADATIVWVPGICRSDARVPAEGSEAWCVECAVA